MHDESPMSRLRDMKHHGLAPSSLAVATATAAPGSPSTTIMLQGPTPVASNTTRSSIYNNSNSGYLFHQQLQQHCHVQAKTVPSSSQQAALADIQRKEQRANEKEAESRECDGQHAHTWLVPKERFDDGNNAENRQDSIDAESTDDDEKEGRKGVSTSSTSTSMNIDIVVSTTMKSREESHSEQERSSVGSRGRLRSEDASVSSGLLVLDVPSLDDNKDKFVTIDDDTATKATKETYKDGENNDDDDDTTKVGNEDLTLSNPGLLGKTFSGGTLGRCGGDDATKNDADAALSFMRSKSQTLDEANDGKEDDESTTIDIIETSTLARDINYTDPSTVANRIRLATDGSSTIVATDNEKEEETVASSAENGNHHRPRHQRRGRGRSHRSRRSRSSTMTSYTSIDSHDHRLHRRNTTEIAFDFSASESTLVSPTSTMASTQMAFSPTSRAPWTNQSEGTSTLFGSLLPGNAGLPRGPSNLLSSLESTILVKIDSIERSVSRIVSLGRPDEIDELERLAAELDVKSDIYSLGVDDNTMVNDEMSSDGGEDSIFEGIDSNTFDTIETAGPMSSAAADIRPDVVDNGIDGGDDTPDTKVVDASMSIKSLETEMATSVVPTNTAKAELEGLRAEIKAILMEMQHLEKDRVDTSTAQASSKPSKSTSDNGTTEAETEDAEPVPTPISKSDFPDTKAVESTQTATDADAIADKDVGVEGDSLTKTNFQSVAELAVNTASTEAESLPASRSNSYFDPVLSVDTSLSEAELVAMCFVEHEDKAKISVNNLVSDANADIDGNNENEAVDKLGIEYSLSSVIKVSTVEEDEGSENLTMKKPLSPTVEEEIDQEDGIELTYPRAMSVPMPFEEEKEKASVSSPFLLSPRTKTLMSEMDLDGDATKISDALLPFVSMDNGPAITECELGLEVSLQDHVNAFAKEVGCANADGEDAKNARAHHRFSFKSAFPPRLKIKGKAFSRRSHSSQKVHKGS